MQVSQKIQEGQKVPVFGHVPLVVAFAGKMGSGKDTAADILEKLAENDIHFVNKRFAGKVRECIQVLTDGAIRVENTYTTEEKGRLLPAKVFGETITDARHRMCSAIETALKRKIMIIGKGEFPNVDETGTPLHTIDPWYPLPITDEVLTTAVDIITGIQQTRELPRWDKAVKVDSTLTVGRLLQLMGSDIGRNLLGPDIWVEAISRDWRAGGQLPTLLRDLRFENENNWCAGVKGLSFLIDADKRLEKPDAKPDTKEEKSTDGRVVSHVSETSLGAIPREKFSMVIPNNGTLEDLKEFITATVWPFVRSVADGF